MRVSRLATAGDPQGAARRIRESIPAPASVTAAVQAILERVRQDGDAAVAELTTEHDAPGVKQRPLRVSEEELAGAERQLAPEVRAGLEVAIEHVGRVAEASVVPDRPVDFPDHQVILRQAPVHRAAVYVPGGRAPYPSTVVMGVVTAHAAGVRDVAVCSPPGPDGDIHPAVRAACRLTGAATVYRMGGAQAVAALAYGTETVTPVDVVVGPGNLYVQEAKRQLSGEIGIDMFAGPSDLLVIAAAGQDPEPIGLDLLAQAEHGPGTLVAAASESPQLLDALQATLEATPDTGAVAWLVELGHESEALEVIEAFAPEHLELLVPQAEQLADRVTRAGCVFVGAASATAFGDYIAGSNHTLPTNGSARFASALSTRHFRRGFTEVRVRDGSAMARAAAPIARAEGFEQHARSMEIRIRENGAP
jgi:histidinol dehydrogenase